MGGYGLVFGGRRWSCGVRLTMGVQELGRGRRSGLSGGLGCGFEAGPVGGGLEGSG